MPLVSAIVLNTREAKRTVRCVTALLEQTIGNELEIIVVDNHSEDDSIGILRNRFGKHPNIRIVENERNRGFGQGNEAGIRHATGTYLLIINPDVTLPRNGLKRMKEVMENDPSIGMLGPQLCFPDGTIRRSFRPFPRLSDVFIKRTVLRFFFRKRLAHYLGTHINPANVQDVDWLAGGCILMRRQLYDDLGGFDRRFFLFFEDTDLCRRIRNAGKRVIYYPPVRAEDGKQRLSEGGFFSIFTKKTVRIHLMSAIRYFWKWRWGRDISRPYSKTLY